MADEHSKRIPRRNPPPPPPPPQPEQQPHSDDLALALSLQQQERDFTMLPATGSDSNDDDQEEESATSEDDETDYDNEYEQFGDGDSFFDIQEIGAELGFSEGEDSNDNDQEMEEDDIDPDELSYEELIALGEIVGEENRGLSVEEISSCLSTYTSRSVDSKTIIDRCVICQVEYNQGGGGEEKLVALPCEHPYHLDCISQWLQLRKVCPICGTEVSTASSKNIGS